MCAPWERCVRAVNTLQQLLARCENVMDAVGTLCGRCRDAVRTLFTRYNWQNWYFYVYSAAIPQRADMVLERCTNAVATPFGVTGALVLSMLKINAAAWRSRRLHSVSTALLAFAQRAPRRSDFFKRCGNAVRTPLWCDRGLICESTDWAEINRKK